MGVIPAGGGEEGGGGRRRPQPTAPMVPRGGPARRAAITSAARRLPGDGAAGVTWRPYGSGGEGERRGGVWR